MAERKYIVRYRLRVKSLCSVPTPRVWLELPGALTLSCAQTEMDKLWDSGHECSAVAVNSEWSETT